jgi:hypothetical protein
MAGRAPANAPKTAAILPRIVNHRKKCNERRRLFHELRPPAGPTNDTGEGTKPPHPCREDAILFLVQNLDPIAALVAGIWAVHMAWCRADVIAPGTEALGRPERWIGPLLLLFALVRFATRP